jgi:hypothetical protein
MAEFRAWPKIANLTDTVTVTEMLDGAGAFAIHIERLKFDASSGTLEIRPGDVIDFNSGDMSFFRLTAQSRTRLITPRDDNHGFAKWVAENASGIAATLGEGIHYGEWWGYKINRSYGLSKGDKRFSLYNTERWARLDGSQVPGLWCVPVLATGTLLDPELLTYEDVETWAGIYGPVSEAVAQLRESGSLAAPGYEKPEGIVVFHTGGRVMFKYVLETTAPVEATYFGYSTLEGTPEGTFRERQEADLTALEQGANLSYEFVDHAYSKAVATALENPNPYRDGLL